MAKTLYDKIWESHLVHSQADGTCLMYVDRHLIHEVTSPQAFEGLRVAGRKVRRPDATLAEGLMVMSKKGLGMCVVVAEGRMLGVFTDGDLRRVLDRTSDVHGSRMREVMTSPGKRRCRHTRTPTA